VCPCECVSIAKTILQIDKDRKNIRNHKIGDRTTEKH
jgi:hypothetical protein